MSRKSVSSLEYQRVYTSGGTHLERIKPKAHMSKKDRRRLKAQQEADTLKWIQQLEEKRKGGQSNGENKNSAG